MNLEKRFFENLKGNMKVGGDRRERDEVGKNLDLKKKWKDLRSYQDI